MSSACTEAPEYAYLTNAKNALEKTKKALQTLEHMQAFSFL
ncbi:MAG: hypothetical protein V1728_05740 [Candidatus Micrarchaeota archaeon]